MWRCGVVWCGEVRCGACLPLQRLEHLTVCDYYPVLEYCRWAEQVGGVERYTYLLTHPFACAPCVQ